MRLSNIIIIIIIVIVIVIVIVFVIFFLEFSGRRHRKRCVGADGCG